MWRLRHTHAGGGGGSQRELRATRSSMRIRLNREIQPMLLSLLTLVSLESSD